MSNNIYKYLFYISFLGFAGLLYYALILISLTK